jgi:hypothetical protein
MNERANDVLAMLIAQLIVFLRITASRALPRTDAMDEAVGDALEDSEPEPGMACASTGRGEREGEEALMETESTPVAEEST